MSETAMNMRVSTAKLDEVDFSWLEATENVSLENDE